MRVEFKYVKIVVFVDAEHADSVRAVMARSGCGHIGKYDSCSFSMKGIGRFRGLEGAKPFIGKAGKLEQVVEERIETICLFEKLDEVLAAIKKVHPYEEPAIDVIPLLNTI